MKDIEKGYEYSKIKDDSLKNLKNSKSIVQRFRSEKIIEANTRENVFVKDSYHIPEKENKKWYIKGKPLDTELDLSEDINNHLIDKNKIEFKKNKGSSENLANFMPYLRSKVRRN